MLGYCSTPPCSNFTNNMKILTNSMTLITPSLDPLGLTFDPVLGHVNHSCEPNAFVMMDGPSVSLRTLMPIKKDEEVYISYIDTTNPFYRRQSELQSRWFFTCSCSKCQKGATLTADKWASDPHSLDDKVKLMADQIIEHENVAQDPANYAGDTQSDKRAAALQGKAFTEYEEAQAIQDPNEVISKIEDAMRLCHESGLWPVYRQPFAALRDDLIVNMLAVGNYPIAWAQCALRYNHILPIHHPVPFHPVRVVQTWQMAVLAVYLAGSPEGINAPGVNMGLIAMMLVKQVLDASSRSHGKDSAFTKSVQRKADEMIVELKRSMGGNPNNEVMNRELEVQRDFLVQMGGWIKI
jgi:hypothetical protein